VKINSIGNKGGGHPGKLQDKLSSIPWTRIQSDARMKEIVATMDSPWQTTVCIFFIILKDACIYMCVESGETSRVAAVFQSLGTESTFVIMHSPYSGGAHALF
jgi:hypothetical protein